MKNFKKILTIILSIGLLVVISCGDKPTDSGSEKKLSNYAGVYEGDGITITISPNGSFNIDGKDIPANSITQNGNTFSFDIDGVKYSLTFNSDTEVECTKNGTQIPLTKKPESGGGGSSGNDIDNQINALFDKFPKPSTATDTAVSSSDGLDGNYKSDGNLTLFPDETEVINYYTGATKEDFIKNDTGKIGFLDISGGKATGYVDYKSQDGKLFENVQIYKNSSGKYYAVAETKSDDGSNNFYIEFNKDDSNGNLTSFKIMRLVRGSNYAVQQTYTGTLLKI